VYGGDFDNNGTNDIVIAKADGEDYYPLRGRQCSSEQMPFIATKFPTYKSYAESTIEDVYEDGLTTALELEVCTMASMLVTNGGQGSLSVSPLPVEAQAAPLRGAVMLDINGDGTKDLVGAGNMFAAEVETVRYDAGLGFCLQQDSTGFSALPLAQTGFYAPGDVHDLALIRIGTARKPTVLVGNNSGYIQALQLNEAGTR
jgi:hypothetical protein